MHGRLQISAKHFAQRRRSGPRFSWSSEWPYTFLSVLEIMYQTLLIYVDISNSTEMNNITRYPFVGQIGGSMRGYWQTEVLPSRDW